jgi:hypothetical protein
MSSLDDISNARITEDDVMGGGFDTELSKPEVKQHIATAHSVVENRLANEGMDSTTLARIELYLARHFIRAGPDRQVESESAGPMDRDYSGDYDHTEFASTAPGQQALMLDKSGKLDRQQLNQFFTLG